MKKYYLKEGDAQQGPFDLEDLQSRNITAETPVWQDGQAEPTPAGQLDDLKPLFTAAPLPTEDPVPTAAEAKPAVEAAPVTAAAATATVTAAAAPKAATPKPAATGKKSTAWVSWLLTLLILGGAGYFVYQDMEKNKDGSASVKSASSDTASVTASTTTTSTDNANVSDTGATTTTTDAVTTTTDPVTTTTTTATTNNAKTDAQQAAAKKAEDDKKKKLELQKKADADRKKQEAADAAAAAKEMEMRNRWPNYISLGAINPNYKGEGVEAFDVPVYNGTNAMLDKVTIRVEYLKKKEKKIYKTENITVNNIPARTTLNARAPESKKGEKVNVIITSITSRKLHFCYPVNNGNAADPYYCN
jgi:hypothetical protein